MIISALLPIPVTVHVETFEPIFNPFPVSFVLTRCVHVFVLSDKELSTTRLMQRKQESCLVPKTTGAHHNGSLHPSV